MSLWRCNIQLAIPEDIFNNIPLARKLAFRDEVRALKNLAVKINDGLANEEMTVTANYHICHHDTDETCGETHEL